MGDKVLRSHTGFVPKVEFGSWVGGRISFFRAVALDDDGSVLFKLVQPRDRAKRPGKPTVTEKLQGIYD